MDKRIAAALIAASVMVSGAAAPSVTVQAAGEQQENTQLLQAIVNMDLPISLTWTHRSYSYDKNTRAYYFIPEQNGFASVSVANGLAENRGVDLMIQSDTGEEIFHKKTKNPTSDDFLVSAGRRYYITLKSNGSYNKRQPEHNVTLRINLIKDDNIENEDNDTSDTATALPENTKFAGISSDSSDNDYYRIELTDDSVSQINVMPYDVSGNGQWSVDIIDGTGNKKTIYRGIRAAKNSVFYLKKGVYYLNVHNGKKASKYNISYSSKKLDIPVPPIKTADITRRRGADSSALHSITLKGTDSEKMVEGYRVKIAKTKKMTGILYSRMMKPASLDKIYLFGDIKTKASKVYITVRPYVTDPFGERIFGKTSGIKGVKISLKN